MPVEKKKNHGVGFEELLKIKLLFSPGRHLWHRSKNRWSAFITDGDGLMSRSSFITVAHFIIAILSDWMSKASRLRRCLLMKTSYDLGLRIFEQIRMHNLVICAILLTKRAFKMKKTSIYIFLSFSARIYQTFTLEKSLRNSPLWYPKIPRSAFSSKEPPRKRLGLDGRQMCNIIAAATGRVLSWYPWVPVTGDDASHICRLSRLADYSKSDIISRFNTHRSLIQSSLREPLHRVASFISMKGPTPVWVKTIRSQNCSV